MDPAQSISPVPAGEPKRTLDAQSKVRLQRAVKEFEAVLVGYMLKSMRASVPRDEESGKGYGGDLFEGMFDMELARHMSTGSHFGLGEMLYKEITGEDMPRQAVRGADRGAPSRPTPAHTAPPVLHRAAAKGPVQVSATATAVPDTVRRNVEAFAPIIEEAADTHGVSPNLLKAVIATESGGRTRAHSAKHAKGLMQLIDTTAAAMGVRNVWDPRDNIHGGAKYLSQMMERFRGNVQHALASYNAGPGAVEKHGGIPPYKETQAYVHKVLNYLHDFEQEELHDNDHD